VPTSGRFRACLPPATTRPAIDGIFGLNINANVRSFQAAHGLGVDGIVGPNTWPELLNVQRPRTVHGNRARSSAAAMPEIVIDRTATSNRHMIVDGFGQRVQMSDDQFRKLAAKGVTDRSRRWRASEAGRSPIL
jgi:peptidoglycan hydrolase-like protein with peptidoglycan-binding domain